MPSLVRWFLQHIALRRLLLIPRQEHLAALVVGKGLLETVTPTVVAVVPEVGSVFSVIVGVPGAEVDESLDRPAHTSTFSRQSPRKQI